MNRPGWFFRGGKTNLVCFLAPVVLLALALGLTVALDDAPPRADLVIANRSDVFTLDPQRMSWVPDLRMAHALYEGLVRWDLDTDRAVPAAAERWTVSGDGLTYTFWLRPDARWSNGDPLRAADFVYAWRRALLPDTAADYTSLFFVIDGAEAFFRRRAERLAAQRPGGDAKALWAQTLADFRVSVGLVALDDRTLVVNLARPVPHFLDLAAFGVFCPVHPPTVEAFVDLDPATGRLRQRPGWTRPGRLIGNGPYVLTHWRYKRGLHLGRNPFYHSPQTVESDTIECRTIEDANTAVLAFACGEIDWLTDVSAEYRADMLAEAAAGRRQDIHALPAYGSDFFSFNCRATLADGRRNPFAEAGVRRAFVLSVDRRQIVERVTRLNEPMATTIIPAGAIAGYRSPRGLDCDPVAARGEMQAAGWSRGADGRLVDASGAAFPVVDLLYSSVTPRSQDVALALRDMWQRELGVEVALRSKESKLFKEDLRRGDFMIGRGTWYGDYGDPSTFLELFRTGDGNNDRGYSNGRVDELLDRAAAELDPQKRLATYEECERLLFQEELPMLVINQLVQMYMYDPQRLSGITEHPRLTQQLWRLKVAGR